MSTTHHLRTTDTRLVSDVHRRAGEDRLASVRRWARTSGWTIRPSNPLDTPAQRALTRAELSAR